MSSIAKLGQTADFVLRDLMAAKAGDEVVITADDSTDLDAVNAFIAAAGVIGARGTALTLPQMPFQGALADPYIPAPVAAAVKDSDIWLDLTFPYMSGSGAHIAALDAKRVRMLSLAGLTSESLIRLFCHPNYDYIYALQSAVDNLLIANAGAECRVTSPLGTDVTFNLGEHPTTAKPRVMSQSATYTPLGSSVIHPDPATVRGRVVLEAAFHEYMTPLHEPLVVDVDGKIQKLSGGGQDLRVMKRSLSRASGGKDYGSIIHFSIASHPYARRTGTAFVEDIRIAGSNAVGFGTPWWEEGGGENHPDGVVTQQSFWLNGEQIMDNGALVHPDLAKLESAF
jgi:leucyl aminopeptidase (aminopeptidase T)